MKRVNMSLCLLMIVLILSSCGYKDIDNRFFVLTVGIDKPKNDEYQYRVVLKLGIPGPEIKAGDAQFIIEAEESNSISEAIRIIKSRVNRELDFGHAKVIIFGEDVLKDPIQEKVDWFMRRRDIQKIAWVAIGSPSAEEIMAIKPKMERIPSNGLFLTFGKRGTDTPYVVSEYLFQFYRDLHTKGEDAIIPIIHRNSKEIFGVDEAAVFSGETLSIKLNNDETKLLNSLKRQQEKLSIRVEGDPTFVIASDLFEASYQIKRKGTKAEIRVTVKAEGVIEEAQTELDNHQLQKYQAIAENDLKNRIEALLTKFRDNLVDPIGFGLMYRSRHFTGHDMEDWENMYPDIPIHVNVKVNVRGTGVIE